MMRVFIFKMLMSRCRSLIDCFGAMVGMLSQNKKPLDANIQRLVGEQNVSETQSWKLTEPSSSE